MTRISKSPSFIFFAVVAALGLATGGAAAQDLNARLDAAISKLEPRVIEWRRDFHQNPELSNREFRTSKIVAEHLKKLGLEVQTGVAKTGVVGVLRGGKPGPTIALRADMDGLPVIEQNELPFRSRVTTTYRNETVGVMHACGHDVHTSVLMGIAEAFAGLKAELPGTVVFFFQPAEEGAPVGEEGGASLMIKEGVLEKYRPEAVFGLHVFANMPSGMVGYRGGPLMAGSDSYRIVVKGRQTHGARPWSGVDPIVVSAQIVNALQTVVSRQVDITANPAIVTVGAIKGGIRHNIIPDEVEMVGTIRTFDPQQRATDHQKYRAHGRQHRRSERRDGNFRDRPRQQPRGAQRSRAYRKGITVVTPYRRRRKRSTGAARDRRGGLRVFRRTRTELLLFCWHHAARPKHARRSVESFAALLCRRDGDPACRTIICQRRSRLPPIGWPKRRRCDTLRPVTH